MSGDLLADAILRLASLVNDRELLASLKKVRNEAVAEQNKLRGLEAERAALARDKAQFDEQRNCMIAA